VHGLLNFLRGYFKAILLVLLISRMISYFVQLESENGFDPIFNYGKISSNSDASDNKLAPVEQGAVQKTS
jgi:hypothetical protein